MTRQERIDNAVAVALARYVRSEENIIAACEQGRISEHDRDERIARCEQEYLNRAAFIRGEKRPRQRKSQPLDDPKAGVVG